MIGIIFSILYFVDGYLDSYFKPNVKTDNSLKDDMVIVSIDVSKKLYPRIALIKSFI